MPVIRSCDTCRCLRLKILSFTVAPDQVVRVLKSSATTTGTRSKIHLDKPTAFRQSQALANDHGYSRQPAASVLGAGLGSQRGEFDSHGARCRMRGFTPFASSVTYALNQSGERLELDFDVLGEF